MQGYGRSVSDLEQMKYERIEDCFGRAELTGLTDLPRPPKELFYQGRWDGKLFSNCVAVIGSRRMSEFGRQAVRRLIPKLVSGGKTIVSGFMYGVDQWAHECAVENLGKTIAVLGFGINWPRNDRDGKLAERLIDSGNLVISEWENQAPTHWTFPLRNRIVAGLAREIYVVEAAVRSGTMITAEIGRKLGRTVHFLSNPV